VANCFKSGQNSTVTRVDATTLVFKRTVKVPSSGDHFYRGLAYGGGSLWVAGGSANPNSVIQIDPRARSQKTIQLQRAAIGLMWADGYGDLWITNFEQGSLTSLHPATGAGQFVPAHGTNPVFPVLDRDTIWVGDWSSPQLLRFPAVGSSVPTRIKRIKLPVRPPYSDVWNVAAGAGSIWATTPRAHALWQIDPQTNHRTRIPMPYLPSGVTADADDVWVTVRE
jgi:streptogramin lyase